MRIEEFTRLAETWGADTARWPQDVQASAAQFAQTAEGGAVLREQHRIDALIDGALPAVPQDRIDRAMRAVVVTLATEKSQRSHAGWSLPRWLVPAAGLACAFAIGAIVAFVDPFADSTSDDLRSALTTTFDVNIIGQGWTTL